MEEKIQRIEELEKQIKEWQEELTMWERNNGASQDINIQKTELRRLIGNAKEEIGQLGQEMQEEIEALEKELEELESYGSYVAGENVGEKDQERHDEILERIVKLKEEVNKREGIIKEYQEKNTEQKEEITAEELLNKIKDEKGKREEAEHKKEVETKRINREIEKIKKEIDLQNSEKKIGYKVVIEECEKRIKELEEERKTLEKAKEEKSEISKEDKIRILSKGKKESEKTIRDIELELKKKQIEVQEAIKNSEMEEKELSNGEKTKVPKVLIIYDEIDKLKEEIKRHQNLIKEYDLNLEKLKGITINKDAQEASERNYEEMSRYFHGQGDLKENTKDDRRANDEFFGLEEVSSEYKKDPNTQNPTKPGSTPKDPTKPDPTPTPKDPTKPDPNTPITDDEKNQKRLDLIEYSENEHIGTWDTINRRNSKMPIFTRWNVLSSLGIGGLGAGVLAFGAAGLTLPGIVAVAGVAASPIIIQTGVKLFGKLNNVIRGTNEKEQNMRDRINSMNEEDFDLLSDSLTRSDIMNEKYGEVWLECVGDRYEQEINKKKEELDSIYKADLEEENEYLRRGEDIPESLRKRHEEYKHKKEELDEKIVNFKDAIDLKSHRKKNTRGGLLGVYNPDRREFNKTSAELHRNVLSATTQEERDQAIGEYEKYRASNVNEVEMFGGRLVSSRGILRNAQEIEIEKEEVKGFEVDRSERTFLRKFINLMVRASGVIMVANNFNDQAFAEQQTIATNKNIDVVNAHNANMQKIIDKVEDNLKNAPTEQAVDDYTRLLLNDSFLTGHNKEFIMEQLGRFNEHGADSLLHQGMNQTVSDYLQAATVDQKMNFLENVAIPYFKENANEILNNTDALKYIQEHPEFNMDGLWENTATLQNSTLSSVQDVVKSTINSAKELGKVAIQKVSPVSFSVPSHWVPAILTTGAGILGNMRDAIDEFISKKFGNKKDKDKAKENEEKEEIETIKEDTKEPINDEPEENTQDVEEER